MEELSFNTLVGRTLREIINDGDEVRFICDNGDSFRCYHMQDCCESVSVYQIDGDLNSIIGSEIVSAYEDCGDPENINYTPRESYTWTNYTLVAANGNRVVIHWLGESNGYYSESVYFSRVNHW